MNSSIGFVVLNHRNPKQLLRLTQQLTRFPGAETVVHHDFSQANLDETVFPSGVCFVHPHIRTQWGHFSVVEATVMAIAALYAGGRGPEWFVVLSGSDYPIRPIQEIVRELLASEFDAHMEASFVDPRNPESAWEDLCYRRYFVTSFPAMYLNRHLRPRTRRFRFNSTRLAPYSDRYRCYSGSQWFSANRDSADCILSWWSDGDNRRRINHYRHVDHSEESFFQTILGNASSLRISQDVPNAGKLTLSPPKN